MNSQDKISILFNEAMKAKLQELQISLNEIVAIQGFLIQIVYESKPKLRKGEVYIETLIKKIIFSSKSVLLLSASQELEIYNSKDRIEIIDTPSIFILVRSIIETFLMLEYLYFDNIEDSEKDFRFNLWRVSGFMSRQVFSGKVSEPYIEKLIKEKKVIEEIIIEIKSSPLYPTLKNNDSWKLNKFGLPRLKSWSNLIESSRLKSETFQKIYSFYSNYAHSEYLAMMQLNEGSLNKSDLHNISSTETALTIVQMINSVTILLMKKRFNVIEEKYSIISNDLKIRIELWSAIATR